MGRALKQRLLSRKAAERRRRSRKEWLRFCRTRHMSWSFSHARCVGSSHIRTDSPCQDWAAAQQLDDETVAISLADGAGSARFSHYGASLVANRTPRLISDHFEEVFNGTGKTDEFIQRLVSQLQIEMQSLAKIGIDLPDEERARHGLPSRNESLLVQCDVSDLSCTMLCVVVKGNRYVAVHVGDGVIGLERMAANEKRLAVVSSPDNGEFANETHFITSRSALETARIVCGRIDDGRKRVSGFILMSDGPEAALFNKRKSSLAGACSKLLDACRELDSEDMREQLEATLKNVIAKKTSDDCSLALMALCE